GCLCSAAPCAVPAILSLPRSVSLHGPGHRSPAPIPPRPGAVEAPPTSDEVQEREDHDPDEVDEVPVQPGDLDGAVARGRVPTPTASPARKTHIPSLPQLSGVSGDSAGSMACTDASLMSSPRWWRGARTACTRASSRTRARRRATTGTGSHRYTAR